MNYQNNVVSDILLDNMIKNLSLWKVCNRMWCWTWSIWSFFLYRFVLSVKAVLCQYGLLMRMRTCSEVKKGMPTETPHSTCRKAVIKRLGFENSGIQTSNISTSFQRNPWNIIIMSHLYVTSFFKFSFHQKTLKPIFIIWSNSTPLSYTISFIRCISNILTTFKEDVT